jgi:hypothetical protein
MPVGEGGIMNGQENNFFFSQMSAKTPYAHFIILTLFILNTTVAYGFNNQPRCSYSLNKIRKIEWYAEELFGGSQPLPGFSRFISDKKNKRKETGNIFELESALYLQQKKCDPILGFSLTIQFAYDGAFVNINNEGIVELATTEFDVISQHHVVECKSSWHPSRTTSMQQLEKEQTMLRWMNSLFQDLQHGDLTISYELGKITLKGPSTCNVNIDLYSNWMDELPIANPIDRFIYIMSLLATKNLLVFFKNAVSPEFAEKLSHNNFRYQDNVQMVIRKDDKLIDVEAVFDQAPADEDPISLSPQRPSTPMPSDYEMSYYTMA